MAPAADKDKDKTFSFEIVACLLAALGNSSVTVGATHFALMEKYDGSTTKSGYEHRFRAVKARAKEINEQSGDIKATPTKPKADASSNSTTPAGSRGKKRSKLSNLRNSEVARTDWQHRGEVRDPKGYSVRQVPRGPERG